MKILKAYMKFFCNLELFQPYRGIKSFNGMPKIKRRAEQILLHWKRTPEQIDCAAIAIRELIDQCKDHRISEEFELHVRRLHEHGGWELDFLENFEFEQQPTLQEIRQLLENWPSWADDKPDFLQAEDISDLDALLELLSLGYGLDNIPGFLGADEIQWYAVLTLMKLEDAAGLLHVPEKRTDSGIPIAPAQYPWTAQATIAAGNMIVDAMEIICYAEHELSVSQFDALRAAQQHRNEEQALRERENKERQAKSDNARAVAEIRWAEYEQKFEQAKDLIRRYLGLWDQNRSLYKNQGEFARDLEEKIEAELGRRAKGELLYSASTIVVKLIPLIRKEKALPHK